MIDKSERFVFWIRESQTNKTPASTTWYPGLLWQRGYGRVQPSGNSWPLQGKSIICIAGFGHQWVRGLDFRKWFRQFSWTLVLRWVLILLNNHCSQLQSTSKEILNLLWLSNDFWFPSVSSILIQNSVHYVIF